MSIPAWPLRQRDTTTCGPSVAVVAGAIWDRGYGAALREADGQVWFAREQGRVHAATNRIWPRRLGMTPMGMAGAISRHSGPRGVRYRWRWRRGRCDRLADVAGAVDAGWPVAVLIGRFIPRHWVLAVAIGEGMLDCYEPSSGEVRSVRVDAVRRGGLTGLGFPRVFAFVLPSAATRSATA